jgi:small conductance mechanosensitive channel
MAHMLKPLFAVAAGIAILIAGVSPSHAQPQAFARQPALEVNVLLTPTAAFALDENSDPAAVRIEEIRAQLATQNLELLAMQKDGETAQGEDAQALWSRSIELRLDSAVTFREWVENVATLAANGAAVEKYEAQLKSLLPGATLSTQSVFETLQKSISDISTQLQSEGEGAPELRATLDRYEEVSGRILSIVTNQLQDIEAHALDSKATKAWLIEHVSRRARLAASRIHLASLRLAEATAASELAPDDTALSAALAQLSDRLGDDTDDLEAVVGLMDTLELETAQYQRILIESTGELTADVFDRGVVGEMTKSWLSSAKESALENGPDAIFKTLIFVLVVFVFWTASRLARRLVERALSHSTMRLSTLLKRMIVSLVSGGVLAIGVLIAFSQLGLEIGPLLAGLGIAGFVLGFALQETLANFAAGIMILAYGPYDVHDMIECAGGVFGKVSQMNLVSTTILTIDNQTRVVPNGKIWGDVITNVTKQSSRRIDLLFGISYSDDIPHTEEVLSAIVAEHPKVLGDPEPMVKLHELGDSSVNFVVRPWVKTDDYWDVYWDITREVKMRFDREGISIPFPQTDVHLPDSSGEPTKPSEAVVSETPLSSQDQPEAEA